MIIAYYESAKHDKEALKAKKKEENRLKRRRKQRSAELQEHVKQIESHQKEINALAKWIENARKGNFWIAESEMKNRQEATGKLSDLFGLPIHELELPKQLSNSLNLCHELYEKKGNFKKECNTNFINKELLNYKDFFDNIEKDPLTDEQRKAIITDEDSTLVVASAGSGKTTLLVGKVAYLVEKGLASPDEILLLAFNKKAQEEISSRLKKLKLNADCNTFHSLGYKVIGLGIGKKPSTASFIDNTNLYNEFMQKRVEEVLTNTATRDLIDTYFISYLRPFKNKFDFQDRGQYLSFINSNNLVTLTGHHVKSMEELEIANFLFINNVNFEYEKEYEHNTATQIHRQYKPDFYLPDYGIYIEHFGINRAGEPAPFIEPIEYKKQIEWKRETHKNNQTCLIETYSYQKREGVLTNELKSSLLTHGVKFNRIDSTRLFKKLNDRGYVSDFAKICCTFLNLFKGNGEKYPINSDDRIDIFIKIFKHIYDGYKRELSNKIDFHDMINTSSELIKKGKFDKDYKYVLIDEFQDISHGRRQLIQSLLDRTERPKLFCVGDDWQSIYRFTGSDISIMIDFEKYFGYTEKLLLSETFRFNRSIEVVASEFIRENPRQIDKNIKTQKDSTLPEVFLCVPEGQQKIDGLLEKIINEISNHKQGKHILFLGRNNFNQKAINFKSLKKKAPDLNMEFKTVHSAKGYEADYVILLDLRKGRNGFPNMIEDDPIINSMLAEEENFPFGEERRLLYVALTRARHRAYLIGDLWRKSDFFRELSQDTYFVDKSMLSNQSEILCPLCQTSYLLVLENKKTGKKFLGCENYNGNGNGCNYSTSYSEKNASKAKNQKLENQQTVTYQNGNEYKGELKNGFPHGKGTMTYPDGPKYLGEWKEGKIYGKGTMTFSDGSKYVGEWKEGKIYGKGTMTYPDGSKYVGELKNGFPHGKGTMTISDGSKYVGEWKDGGRHGKGTMTVSDGSKYVGEWKDGKEHGKGTATISDGRKVSGIWKNGEFVE